MGHSSGTFCDARLDHWWGLSGRGPGGGLLDYETRVQCFTLDIAAHGAISDLWIAEIVCLTQGGQALNGIASSPTSVLGRAFDPEGIVVNPANGKLVVSED